MNLQTYLINYLIAAAVIAFLGVMVRYFKWYWILAGYNTASKEYKARFDIEGLGRVWGYYWFAVAIVVVIYGVSDFYHYILTCKIIRSLLYLSFGLFFIKSQTFDPKLTKTKMIIASVIALLVVLLLFFNDKSLFH